MRYLYGKSWEKYPIGDGETWVDLVTGSMVTVCDIIHGMPEYMFDADMIYCDPPWSLGNTNSFYTKAGKTESYIHDFSEFYSALFARIAQINPRACYLEIGKRHADIFEREMGRLFPSVGIWEIRYYRKNPCLLVRGGERPSSSFDFTGLDDTRTPAAAIDLEYPSCVADLCTGQGLTAVAAFKAGKRFVGTELNRRRLAVAIDRVNKLGGRYESAVS